MREGPRPARLDELEEVISLANHAFYPDGSGDMGGWFPGLFSPGNLENLRLVLDDGRPVSMVGMEIRDAAILSARLRLACVGSVCTREEYRGQGLASLLMDDLVAAARQKGAVAILVSGGRGLYRRMGCVDAGLYRTVTVARAAALPPVPGEVREWREEDVNGMAALYDCEPVRFLRGPEEFRAFLRTCRIECRPARTWVVRAPDGLAAYLCAAEPRKDAPAHVLGIRELAGSRRAALAAIPRVLAAHGAEQALVDALAADTEMESLAAVFGLPVDPRGFQGTIRIIDGEGFTRAIEGLVRARAQAKPGPGLRISWDGDVVFRLGAEVFRAGGESELSVLAFGSLERQPPLPSPGPLREALTAVFPLPLVDYGLGYV